MAPNVGKVRQRRYAPVNAALEVDNNNNDSNAKGLNDAATSDRLIANLSSLRPNEIAIDGIIYNLDTFDHPGGDAIQTFGGNDVTIQYRMIHPYHTSKHLEKLPKVGKVVDYTCEYKFDTDFEREIKSEVFKIVRRGREFGTFGWFARAFVYLGLYLGLQYIWVTRGTSWTVAILYGISKALVALNITHDANHGASSRNPLVNEMFGFGTDFIGGSKWLWQQQHWTHHAYTNHEKDPDMYGGEPFFLYHNYPAGHPKRRFFHRLQALYFGFIVALFWISSVFHPEIFTLKQHLAEGVGLQTENDYIKSRRKYAIAIRVFYIYCNVIRPLQISFTILTAAHIFVMGVSFSVVLAFLFTLSHNFVDSDRYPTKDVAKTGEPVCWYKSQVETSSTYGGAIAGYLTGGLNYQIEHHLFPRMSSSWYPYIAPTVRKVCKKHGVKYTYYPWIHQNLYSSMKYLHQAGSGEVWKTLANPLSGAN